MPTASVLRRAFAVFVGIALYRQFGVIPEHAAAIIRSTEPLTLHLLERLHTAGTGAAATSTDAADTPAQEDEPEDMIADDVQFDDDAEDRPPNTSSSTGGADDKAGTSTGGPTRGSVMPPYLNEDMEAGDLETRCGGATEEPKTDPMKETVGKAITRDPVEAVPETTPETDGRASPPLCSSDNNDSYEKSHSEVRWSALHTSGATCQIRQAGRLVESTTPLDEDDSYVGPKRDENDDNEPNAFAIAGATTLGGAAGGAICLKGQEGRPQCPDVLNTGCIGEGNSPLVTSRMDERLGSQSSSTPTTGIACVRRRWVSRGGAPKMHSYVTTDDTEKPPTAANAVQIAHQVLLGTPSLLKPTADAPGILSTYDDGTCQIRQEVPALANYDDGGVPNHTMRVSVAPNHVMAETIQETRDADNSGDTQGSATCHIWQEGHPGDPEGRSRDIMHKTNDKEYAHRSRYVNGEEDNDDGPLHEINDDEHATIEFVDDETDELALEPNDDAVKGITFDPVEAFSVVSLTTNGMHDQNAKPSEAASCLIWQTMATSLKLLNTSSILPYHPTASSTIEERLCSGFVEKESPLHLPNKATVVEAHKSGGDTPSKTVATPSSPSTPRSTLNRWTDTRGNNGLFRSYSSPASLLRTLLSPRARVAPPPPTTVPASHRPGKLVDELMAAECTALNDQMINHLTGGPAAF